MCIILYVLYYVITKFSKKPTPPPKKKIFLKFYCLPIVFVFAWYGILIFSKKKRVVIFFCTPFLLAVYILDVIHGKLKLRRISRGMFGWYENFPCIFS